MKEKLEQWLQRARLGRIVQRGGQRGQSLIIVVLAFIGILALIGLGIDLGLVYVERVRVARAADAAALAAVADLPLEAGAHMRALSYLQENGYDYTGGGTQVIFNWVNSPREATQGLTETSDCLITSLPLPADVAADMAGDCMIGSPGASVTIWIDTAYSRPEDIPMSEPELNTASRIRIKVRKKVPMTFLQFVGWHNLPVEATAEAENISNLDVAIVFDQSGSMRYQTVCFGCWSFDPDVDDAPFIYPLTWAPHDPTDPTDTMPPDDPTICQGWSNPNPATLPRGQFSCGSYIDDTVDPSIPSGYERNDCNYRDSSSGPYYIVLEAEEYSTTAGEDYRVLANFSTYWAIQRDVNGSNGRDSYEGYIAHHPYLAYSSGGQGQWGVPCTADDIQNGGICRRKWSTAPAVSVPAGVADDLAPTYRAPRADYDFVAPVTDDYYIWARGQDGYVHWGGLDGTYLGETYRGAVNFGNNWEWQPLGDVPLNAGQIATLHIWAGSAGFKLDRIIISNDSNRELETAQANYARTRKACSPCDPRYAGSYPGPIDPSLPYGHTTPALLSNVNFDELKVGSPPTAWRPWCRNPVDPDDRPDNTDDRLWMGEQPMYDAREAVKNFISKMDPALDQVGYVRYTTDAVVASDMQCLRLLGPENLTDPGCTDGGLCDPDIAPIGPGGRGDGCIDACGCFEGVFKNTVIYQIDKTEPDLYTNIGAGTVLGTNILRVGTCPPRCGRPGAAKVMIVLTDGHANRSQSGCDGATLQATLDRVPDNPFAPANLGDAECAAQAAFEAAGEGILIYTITVGDGADQELMRVMADLTGGTHYHAIQSDKLNAIFDELFKRIFLRLIA